MFADGEAHAGAEPEGGSDGAGNDAVSAHDLRRDVAQSASHSFSDRKKFFLEKQR